MGSIWTCVYSGVVFCAGVSGPVDSEGNVQAAQDREQGTLPRLARGRAVNEDTDTREPVLWPPSA